MIQRTFGDANVAFASSKSWWEGWWECPAEQCFLQLIRIWFIRTLGTNQGECSGLCKPRCSSSCNPCESWMHQEPFLGQWLIDWDFQSPGTDKQKLGGRGENVCRPSHPWDVFPIWMAYRLSDAQTLQAPALNFYQGWRSYF